MMPKLDALNLGISGLNLKWQNQNIFTNEPYNKTTLILYIVMIDFKVRAGYHV